MKPNVWAHSEEPGTLNLGGLALELCTGILGNMPLQVEGEVGTGISEAPSGNVPTP